MRHRTPLAAITDVFLLVLCGTILTLAWTTTARPSKLITVRDQDGIAKTYLVDASDPLIRQLQIPDPKKPRHVTTSLARSKWMRDISKLYAQQESSSSNDHPVQPVSYQHSDSTDSSTVGVPPQPHSPAYWRKVQQEAEAQIDWIRSKSAEKTIHRPTIESIDDCHQYSVSWTSMWLGIGVGTILAGGFVIWSAVVPTRRLESVDGNQVQSQVDCGDSQLAMAIPASWIRVRQPVGVWLRRLAYLAVLLLTTHAAITLFSRWTLS